MSYWDTSALTKRYTEEPDSATFMELGAALLPLHTSRLAEYELHTTLRRKEADGVIAPGAAASALLEFQGDVVLGIIILHEVGPALRKEFAKVLADCFSAIPIAFVRTADAIHIATARAAGETDFVTADARQKKAAETCGLTVHP